MKYLQHYSPRVLDQVEELIDTGKLGAYLRKKHPDTHEIQSDRALYDYAMELKRKYMSSSAPLRKVRYCEKISTLHRALGMHTYATRVHGGKLKTRHELRVASIFKKGAPEFLECIVVHELAHLKYKDHDKPFYNLCCHMMPTYHQAEFDLRLWLTWVDMGEPE